MSEYQERVKAVFPHRIEIGTMPAPGGSTYVVVGFTMESNGYKACFALTTIEAASLSHELAESVRDLEGQ